tara:strand:- start:1856 stop:2080 length:225 start_codon:yes stop_codon:yes gene_type:complete
MTSFSNDYSNNIINEAIDISNKMKKLIEKLNEKNDQDVSINETKNEKILLPAGGSSRMLSTNKTNILWKNSLRN